MSVMDVIKKAAAELAGAKRTLDAEIEQLHRRREELKRLPLPKHDAIAALHEAVDVRVTRWRESFLLTVAPLRDHFEEHPSMMFLESNGGYAESNRIFPDALYMLLAPTIKKTIASEIEAMEWPALTGPPRAERARELAKVNQRIAAIEAEREELRESARATGIDIDVLTPEAERKLFAGGRPTTPVSIDKARQRA